MITILPIIFDLVSPKKAPLNWNAAATNAFLSKDKEGRRLMMISPDMPGLACDPDTITKAHRKTLMCSSLAEHPEMGAFLAQSILNFSPFANRAGSMHDLKKTLTTLTWPLDYDVKSVLDMRKTQQRTWISHSGIWVTPTAKQRTAQQWLFGMQKLPQNDAPTTIRNPLPVIQDPENTIVVVGAAPELGANTSAHLRMDVYHDLMRQIGLSHGTTMGHRMQWQQHKDLTVLPPHNAGSIILP